MLRSLSFEQTPPLSVPLRFLLSAPLFAVLAAALLLWQGPLAWTSRWSPLTLALTHFLTLGCLSMTMIGALMQILAVVAGVHFPHERATAHGIYLLLSAGTLLLAAGFLFWLPPLFQLALLLLLGAIVWLLISSTMALRQMPASGARATVIACGLALLALAVTGILGAIMAGAFAWPRYFLHFSHFLNFQADMSISLTRLTAVHALWGLAGWVGLLIVGIAFQVVPMFQVTEIYPRAMTRFLVPGLFLLVVLWSVAAIMEPDGAARLSPLILLMICAGFCWFAAITLSLLAHRKRPEPDVTTLFWRLALISVLGSAGLLACRYGIHEIGPNVIDLPLGALMIIGFAYSAINGMLYKIVPFLLWYHMQASVTEIGIKVPPIREILPDNIAKRQFWLHLLALSLLLAATVWPSVLSRVAALALGGSSLWLWFNLWQATRVYRNFFETA
jgi:hypothetical protein